MYNYHKLDYSKNKSMYMYSNYYGKKFINNFKLSRSPLSKEKKIFYKSKLIKLSKSNLSLLLSFEKKKKIFIKKKEISLNDYIELSYFSGIQIKKNINLIYLNTLLKLNDYILYLLRKSKNNLNNKVDYIFIIEKDILNYFCNKIKIDEKIKF